MGYGQGWGSNIGAAVQSDPLTLVQPTMTIPIDSETLRGKRVYKPTGSLYGTRTIKRQLPAVREAQGGLSLEVLPNMVGQLIAWWNGQETVAAVPAPTSLSATASSTGTVPSGSNSFKVAPIYTYAGNSQQYIGPASSSATASSTGSEQVGLTWTAPSSVPTGFTIADYAIYVKRPGQSVWTYLANVGSTTAAYTDTGSLSPNGVTQPLAALYHHTFVIAAAAPLTNPLPYISLVKSLDNDHAEWFAGWMIDEFALNLGNSGEAAKANFNGMALNFGTQANVSGSPVLEDSAMNWQAHCSVAGSATNLFEGLTLSAKNGLAYVDGLRGTDYHRAIYPDALRTITGTLQMAHENQDQFARLVAEEMFDLSIVVDGSWSHNIVNVGTGVQITPLPTMILDMPTCAFTEAGGLINGPKRIVENLPFVTADSTGVDLQIDMFVSQSTFY